MGPEQLPGILGQTLVLVAIIAYPLAWLMLRRYTTVVDSFMTAHSGAPTQQRSSLAKTPLSPPPAYVGPVEQLRRELATSPWRSAGVQAFAALSVALATAILFLDALRVSKGAMSVVAVTIPLLWPGTIAVILSAGMSRRQRIAILFFGALIYAVIGMVALRSTPTTALAELAQLSVPAVLPTLYLAPFFTRRMRATGPLILLVTVFPALAVIVALPLTEFFPAMTTRVIVALSEYPIPVVFVQLIYAVLVGLLALSGGLLLLAAIARAYSNDRIGDDTIALSALWLTFIIFVSSFHLANHGVHYVLLGLCAYPLYLGVVWLGNGVVHRARSKTAPTLLLLRIFARQGPTEPLFHIVGRHWRHVGPMTMIGGWDLASTTIEPYEIIQYWRGNTADVFITHESEAMKGLVGSKGRRDVNGRYRLQKRYCGPAVWKTVATSLIGTSSVILADLRLFGVDDKVHDGIRFELEALVQGGAISRTVILRNDSTAVQQMLEGLGVDASSVSVLHLTGDTTRDTPVLLDHLAKRCQRVETEKRNDTDPAEAV